jgi:hypothetical protein
MEAQLAQFVTPAANVRKSTTTPIDFYCHNCNIFTYSKDKQMDRESRETVSVVCGYM